MKKPEIRYLNDIKKVLYDQKWAKKTPDFELYYMYRGVKKKNGLPAQILKNKTWEGLRYDITIIPSRMLGQEFVKTKGHEHLNSYGEIYIVLSGKAIYLMQKYQKGKIKDIYAVQAKKGEVVVIPPFYGHITINPAQKELKMANWISENCKSDYQLFEKMRGAGYYYTRKGWVKNKNYKRVPKLRFEKPLKTMPKNLDFLKG